MPRPPLRRWARRLLIGAAVLLGPVVVALALLQTSPVATWAARRFVRLIPLAPGHSLEVGRVSGNWVTGVQLEHMKLRRGERELARIDRLRLGYDPRELAGGRPRLRRLTVDGAEATARRERGTWDLANVLRRSADTAGGGGGFAVDRLELRDVRLAAQLAPDSVVRVRGLFLRARGLAMGDVAVATIDTLAAQIAPPTRPPLWFTVATRGAATAEEFRLDPLRITTDRSNIAGRVVWPRRFDEPRIVDRLALQLEANPLALADVATLAPGVRPDGVMRLEARASAEGRTAAGGVVATLGTANLILDGSTVLGTGGPTVYRVHGIVRGLDPARVYRAAPAGRLNIDLDADLSGPSRGRLDGPVDLRITDSRMAGRTVKRFRIRADFRDGRAAMAVRGAVDTMTVAANGWARPFDTIPSGELATEVRLTGGRIAGLVTLRFGDPVSYQVRHGTIDVDLARMLGDTLVGPLSGRFTLRGQGLAPAAAVVTARVELDELRHGARRVEGIAAVVRLSGGRAQVEAQGTLQGGRLAFDAVARPFDSTATFTIRRAALERVDVGALLDRPDLAGPVTIRARGSGRWRGETRAFRGRLELEPSRLGRIEITGGALTTALQGDRITYDGSVRTSGGSLGFAGGARFAGAPSFTILRGRADSINLGTLLGRPGLETSLNSRFTAAATGRGLDSLRGNVNVGLLPSRINETELRSGRLTLALDRGAIQGDARAESPDGTLDVKLSGRATGESPAVRADGTVQVERLARWTGRANADGWLAGRFSLEGVGDREGLSTIGGTVNAAGAVGEVRLESLHLALRPEPGVLAVDTVLVRSNVATLDGGGRVALRQRGGTGTLRQSAGADVPRIVGEVREGSAADDTLRLIGRAGDLTPLATLAGADSIALDSARVALTVTGPAWHWRLAGEAEANRLLYAGNLVEQIEVGVNAAMDSTRVAGVAGALRVKGAAVGRVAINDAAVTARYDSVVALQATATLSDSIRLAAALHGTVVADTVRARLERLELVETGGTWTLEQPADLMLRPRIEVDGFALHTGGRRIIVDGRLDRRGTSDLSLRLNGVGLDVLRELGLVPIPGRLDGYLRLTGPAATPSLEGRLGLTIRDDNGQELGRLASDLAWTAAGLRIEAAAVPRQGGRLTASGTLPWRLTLAPADTAANAGRARAAPDTAANVGLARATTDTLGFVVRADSFDLTLFDPLLPPETARNLDGTLALDAQVAGTLGKPRVDGRIHLTGAGVTLPTIDVTYRQGELVAALAGDQLRIERLRLLTGKNEELTAQGTVRLQPLANPSLDLTADLSDFRISNSPTLHAIASGKLRLQGTAEVPVLTGGLSLGRAEVFQGAQAKAAVVEQVKLTPADLQELAQHFGPAALARADEGPGLVERFRLDIDLRLPGNVWFRRRVNPRTDIELSGRLKLRQEPGQEMEFVGRVEPTPNRGFLDVYGRSFHLTGGTITMAGPVDSMTLDVTAQYQVPTQAGPDAGILIDVAAKGRPDSLALQFTAEPAMSEDDIIAYIVTGRPASENPLAEQQGGSPAEAGAELAFGALSERIAGAAGEKLGLDVFQIRQDGLRGLTLTAGRYVAPRLFLSLQQPIQLSSDAQQTPGANFGPGFELEYTTRRWLRANLRGGSLPPRFFLRGRYAY